MKINKLIKEIFSMLIVCSMLLSSNVASAKTDYLADMNFSEVITNTLPPNISVDGSTSGRIVEDANKNKSFMIETTNKDNTIKINFPKEQSSRQYFVQFDVKFDKCATGGTVKIQNNAGQSSTLCIIKDDSSIYTWDNKKIGGVGVGIYTTLGFLVDLDYKFLTVYIDNKMKLDRWNLDTAVKNVATLVVDLNQSQRAGEFYLDRVKSYSGKNYINEKTADTYNDRKEEYIPIDETIAPKMIYFNSTFDDVDDLGVAKQAKTNSIKGIIDKNTKNGYMEISKTTSEDCFVDVVLSPKSKNIVLEGDFKYDKDLTDVTLFYLRDSVTNQSAENIYGVSLKNGTISDNRSSIPMVKNKWYKVAITLNLKKSVYSVYVNGDLFTKDVAFSSKFKNVSFWRVYISGGGNMGDLCVDNMRAYDGDMPRDISDEKAQEVSKFNDDKAINFLKGKTAFQAYSNKIFSNNNKQDADIKCKIVGEEVLVSALTIEKLFGQKVSIDKDNITIGNSATMKKDVKKINVGNREIDIDVAPQKVGENLLIPLVAYGKNCDYGKKLYNDSHGMYLISDNDTYQTKNALTKEANLYLFFDRKSQEELKADFQKKNPNGNEHPRILATADDFSRLRKEITTDKYKKQWFEKLKIQGDILLEKPVSTYVISSGRLLDVSNETIIRVKLLAMLYQLTNDEKYAKRCYEELKNVCEFKDWNPEHCLDTGIMASAVGIGFDWLYHYMNEEQRQTIVTGAIKNGFVPAKQAYYGRAGFNDFWTDTETNWGFIVNGGIATLSMAIAEYDIDYSMDILRNALYSIEKPWYRMAPDGAWYEGPAYWSFGGTHLTTFIASYETAMGEQFGREYKGMHEFAKYQAYFADSNGKSNNFHDSNEEQITDHLQFYLGKIYDDKALIKHRLEDMIAFKCEPNPLDLLWYDVSVTDMKENIQLEKDAYYRETEFLALRENWNDPRGLWFSAHAGFSNNAHDHVDEGSFVFNLGGVRWAVDLGTEGLSYTDNASNPSLLAGYNGYYFYRRKGEGHNIVVINPDNKLEMDQTAFAKITPPVSGENGVYSSVDLKGHYIKNVKDYKRGYLISDGRRSLTVRDEIELKNESEMYWFMHTRGDIAIVDNNTAIIFDHGQQLKVQFLCDAPQAQLSVTEAKKLPQSPQFKETANPTITKLAYKINGNGKVNITVKMSLASEEPSKTPPLDIPISQWSVSEIAPCEYSYATSNVDMIKLDDKEIFGFKSDVFNYDYTLEEDGRIPVISATSKYKTQINTYDGINGTKLVEIRAFDDNGYFNSYVVKLHPYSALSVGAYNRHKVYGAQVSHEQDGNERAGSYDGNMDTRWSADGKNEWLVHDLGEEKEIDAIGVALWKGGERTFSYDILISSDGTNFTKILSHASKGENEDLEIVTLEKPVKARYVKYLGYGNNINKWNNVIELAALKKK